jgi:putative cell wall-binding protein
MVATLIAPWSASAVPVPIAGSAAIYGVVTPDAGGTFSGTINAELSWTGGGNLTSYGATLDAGGYYEITNLPATGTFSLTFYYVGSGGWANTGWAPPGGVEGGTFTLAANQVLEVNGPLHRGAVISGTVSVPAGTTLQHTEVHAYNAAGRVAAFTTANATTGAYSLVGLTSGQYRIEFWDNNPLLLTTFNSGKSILADAPPISVVYGQTVTGVDVTLRNISAITGILSYDLPGGGTAPLANTKVTMIRLQDYGTWSVYTDSQGRYVLNSGPGYGPFIVAYYAPAGSGLVSEFWPGVADYRDATVLTVADGQFIAGMDVTLARGASLTGRVLSNVTVEQPLSFATVQVYRKRPSTGIFEVWANTATNMDGTYALDALPAGDYVVKATEPNTIPLPDLGSEYWPNAKFFADATVITLTEGQSQALSDIVLVHRATATVRIADSTRFSTAVAITKTLFPETSAQAIPILYIANGLKYPDALAAGPAAIHGGGALLTVTPTNIPEVVAVEIERLHPKKIVVVGGPASVSEDVFTSLGQYVANPATDLQRIGGATRFEVAEKIIEFAFAAPVQNAYFATGLNYPDALAAAPAAGALDAPIFLVDGTARDLSADTVNLMYNLHVSDAHIVGGSHSMSDSMVHSITSSLRPTGPFDSTSQSRYEGTNRYTAAVAVNRNFVESDIAFLASGAGYADALAGGPLAGAWGVPLYLSTPTCVPPEVLVDLKRLNVNLVVLLGGEMSLGTKVKNLVSC